MDIIDKIRPKIKTRSLKIRLTKLSNPKLSNNVQPKLNTPNQNKMKNHTNCYYINLITFHYG